MIPPAGEAVLRTTRICRMIFLPLLSTVNKRALSLGVTAFQKLSDDRGQFERPEPVVFFAPGRDPFPDCRAYTHGSQRSPIRLPNSRSGERQDDSQYYLEQLLDVSETSIDYHLVFPRSHGSESSTRRISELRGSAHATKVDYHCLDLGGL
ncbi:hypothetical protein BC835DRAFT_206839 [Cytidiella melzeri]|nr:hypothetical protein BC835DRAFT_206839 [Cytidiella melzeri]